MLGFFFQNIGKAADWGNAGGINGYVLFAMCTIMILLFGLLSWQFKRNDTRFERVMKTHEERDGKFIESLDGINREMSKNALDITKPLVEMNIRQIDMQNDISKVMRNQTELAGLTETTMKDVVNELQTVHESMKIVNETLIGIHKNNQ